MYELIADLLLVTKEPRKAMGPINTAAIRDYPTHYEFYAKLANMLQEKWFGAPGELKAYAESLLTSPGGDMGLIAYSYVAGILRSANLQDASRVLKNDLLSWPSVKAGYLARDKRYGLSQADWNDLVNYTWAAPDDAFAATLLPRLKTIAEAGDKFAQANLGWMYFNGLGVTKDMAESKRWYKMAAEQGYALAEFQIGYIDENSDPKDYADALKWYTKAVDDGEIRGYASIGKLYENGYGVTQNYAEAEKWYGLGSKRGSPRAMFFLGSLFDRGLNGARDEEMARHFIEMAAAAGNDEAQEWVKQHPRTPDDHNRTPAAGKESRRFDWNAASTV
jgi:hypothetical protein